MTFVSEICQDYINTGGSERIFVTRGMRYYILKIIHFAKYTHAHFTNSRIKISINQKLS